MRRKKAKATMVVMKMVKNEKCKDVYDGTFKDHGTFVKWIEKPKLKDPIFIEGLPGIGYVGRNAAGYLVDELKAVKFAELYSYHFPHVVLVDGKTGVIREIKNEFFYWKAKKKGQRDLIILIGDAQSMEPKGHYLIAEKIIDIVSELGAKEIITLGGFATGEIFDREPKVYGAGISEKDVKKFEKLGVVFKNTNVGQIIGAAGLLLAVGRQRGMSGACLMGETSGMLISDPKATEALLKTLVKYLKIDLDFSKIEAKVKEIEEVMKKVEDLQQRIMASLQAQQELAAGKKEEDEDRIRYIG